MDSWDILKFSWSNPGSQSVFTGGRDGAFSHSVRKLSILTIVPPLIPVLKLEFAALRQGLVRKYSALGQFTSMNAYRWNARSLGEYLDLHDTDMASFYWRALTKSWSYTCDTVVRSCIFYFDEDKREMISQLPNPAKGLFLEILENIRRRQLENSNAVARTSGQRS
jgi:hypothetical protein